MQFIWVIRSFERFLAISFVDRFLCGDVVLELRLFDRCLIRALADCLLLLLPLSFLSRSVDTFELELQDWLDSRDTFSRGTLVCLIINGGMGCFVCTTVSYRVESLKALPSIFVLSWTLVFLFFFGRRPSNFPKSKLIYCGISRDELLGFLGLTGACTVPPGALGYNYST